MSDFSTIIEVPQPLTLQQRSDDLKELEHLFTISDESRDSYDTVFKIQGWDLSRRKMKKRVTYGHPSFSDLDPDNIIGIGEESISGTQLISKLTLEDEEKNPKAGKIHYKLNFGSLTDASIRAQISDGRMGKEELGENPKIFYFTQSKLIDWGVVMEGSNENAVKIRERLAGFIKSKVPYRYHSDINYLKALSTKYFFT
jgi:hypothetical protein